VHLTSYEGADYWGGTIHDETFVVSNVPADRLVITEGHFCRLGWKILQRWSPGFRPLHVSQ
jgi:hypothetical protein